MTFTAVLKRMARMGFDLHVTLEHNGWVHLMATHKGSGSHLENADGEVVIASATLFGDREYNVLATLDVVAAKFIRLVERGGLHRP